MNLVPVPLVHLDFEATITKSLVSIVAPSDFFAVTVILYRLNSSIGSVSLPTNFEPSIRTPGIGGAYVQVTALRATVEVLVSDSTTFIAKSVPSQFTTI